MRYWEETVALGHPQGLPGSLKDRAGCCCSAGAAHSFLAEAKGYATAAARGTRVEACH